MNLGRLLIGALKVLCSAGLHELPHENLDLCKMRFVLGEVRKLLRNALVAEGLKLLLYEADVIAVLIEYRPERLGDILHL